MHRLPLVFTHGNGVPRPVYQKMLIGLSHRFMATGIDRFGHDPRYPVTDSWPRLLDQLRDHVVAIGEPVTLLGHGSGGWLSLLAAYRMPERVRSVILLDAQLPSVVQARLLQLMKQAGMARLPAWIWDLMQKKSLDLDPDCQVLYRRFGCQPADAKTANPQGFEARRFDQSVSRLIRETYPTSLAALVAAGPPVDGSGRVVPCGLLIGKGSFATRFGGLRASRQLVGQNLVRVEGSHRFPLERPLVTAKEIVRLHDRMVGLGSTASSVSWPATLVRSSSILPAIAA